MMKLKRFGNLVTDEVSPLLSELLQSFAQETGQITYTDIYNYKGNTEKNKKLIYHINKWNEYIESGQDDKALKKSDEIRQMVKGQKEFSMTDLSEVTFKTRSPELLTKIVNAIGELGNPGHTFTIVLDPGSESETKFTWDGDGSDYIELDNIKSFSEREQVPQYIADEVDASGVVVKYNGDWRIVSKKTTPYEFWDAKYKTKQDAEGALAAYHANKGFSGGDYLIGYRKSDPSKKVMAYPSKVSTEFIKVGTKTYPSHKSATEDAKRYNITEDTWIKVLGEVPKYYVVGDSGYASYKIYEDTKKLLKLIRSNGEVPSTAELNNKISEIIDGDSYWRKYKDMGTKYLKERLDRSLPKFREYII